MAVFFALFDSGVAGEGADAAQFHSQLTVVFQQRFRDALERNRELIGGYDCFTVWLDAPFELCWERIANEDNSRPLARDQVKTHQLYDLRRVSYELAMLRVEVAKENSAEDLSERIIEALPR